MNDGEFTGLDINLCKSQLQDWRNKCYSLYSDCNKAILNFNTLLALNWYSPIAVQKNDILHDYCWDMLNEINDLCFSVLQNACGAIRALAIKNGVEFDSTFYEKDDSFGQGEPWLTTLKESGPKGSGMNKSRVINTILPDFIGEIKRVIDSLSGLPMDLAVYDERGNIYATYRELIKSHQEKMITVLEEINSEITEIIDSQVENIRLGVVEAESKMAA